MINLQRGTSFFVNLVIALTALLSLAFYTGVENTELSDQYIEKHTQTASALMNQVLGEQTTTHSDLGSLENEIRSHDLASILVESTSYAYLLLAIIAAIIAWPSNSILKKATFIVGAVGIGLALHLLHTIVLLEVHIWWPLLAGIAEYFALPLTLISFWLLYFWVWTRLSGGHPSGTT